MALIKIELSAPPIDGMDVKFQAPCDCSEATGLLVTYPEGNKEFTFRDCHSNNLADLSALFGAGAYVKVMLDVQRGHAYLQNADTNAHLEQRFIDVTLYATDPNNDGNIVLQYGGVVEGGGGTGGTVPGGGSSGGLTAEEVQAMIDAALGGIENGTY